MRGGGHNPRQAPTLSGYLYSKSKAENKFIERSRNTSYCSFILDAQAGAIIHGRARSTRQI